MIGILGIGYNAYHWFDGVTQYRIAHMYFNGIILKKDLTKAFCWLTRSAERGFAYAQAMLGTSLIQGDGIKKNEREGFKWLIKSAENGCSNAQFNLGSCYYNETGTAKNNEEAFKWIKKAAEQPMTARFSENAPDAYFILGQLYARGEGCETNKKEAVKWITKAAEKGKAEAQYYLAMCYLDGRRS